jgi:single-strand DNA-binding protein
MRGVNKVMLIGTLGADPKVNKLPSGLTVADVSLATSNQWTDKSGTKQEKTTWHKVVFYNRLAEIIAEYVRKGSKIYVEGSLDNEKYTDKNNIERYVTKIKAVNMQMLDSKKERENQKGQNSQNGNVVSEQTELFDDDIPF